MKTNTTTEPAQLTARDINTAIGDIALTCWLIAGAVLLCRVLSR